MKRVFIFSAALFLVPGCADTVAQPEIKVANAVASGWAEKSTGDAWTVRTDGDHFYAKFNVHEAVGERAAKGDLYWEHQENGATWKVSISYVAIDGNTAFFGGSMYDVNSDWMTGTGEYEGRTPTTHACFKVVDNGTPGSEGDFFRTKFFTDAGSFEASCGNSEGWSSNVYHVTDGNFTVHTK